MKITWNQNPLLTKIELDEHDKELLRLKIKVEQLEERAYSAQWSLKNYGDKHPRVKNAEEAIASALKDLDPDYIHGFTEGQRCLDDSVEEILNCYIEELASEHCGDCTCVPCSCTKCHAEEMLGIHTTKGLGKHQGHKIWVAFGKDGKIGIHDAIAFLAEYDPIFTGEGGWANNRSMWDAHAPRWKKEAADACEWLKNYLAQHPEFDQTGKIAVS